MVFEGAVNNEIFSELLDELMHWIPNDRVQVSLKNEECASSFLFLKKMRCFSTPQESKCRGPIMKQAARHR